MIQLLYAELFQRLAEPIGECGLVSWGFGILKTSTQYANNRVEALTNFGRRVLSEFVFCRFGIPFSALIED